MFSTFINQILLYRATFKKCTEPVLVGKGAKENPHLALDNLDHYEKVVKQISDLKLWKEEVEKYCMSDCVSLHLILSKLQKMILCLGCRGCRSPCLL